MQFGEKFIYRKFLFPESMRGFLLKFKMPGILFHGMYGTMTPYRWREFQTNNQKNKIIYKPITLGMVFGVPIKVEKVILFIIFVFCWFVMRFVVCIL